jgi:hypothetical protein
VAVNRAELLRGNIYFIERCCTASGIAPRAARAIHRVPRGKISIARPSEQDTWFIASKSRSGSSPMIVRSRNRRGLAQAGGDTDTNAAVAGALLGARYGETALPPRWMDQLVGAQGIGKLAEDLVSG